MTGLGTPVANLLVPDLIAYQGPGTTYSGPTVGPCRMPPSPAGRRSTRSTCSAPLTATGSGSSGALSFDTSLAAGRATSLINPTPTVAVTTTSAAAPGSPIAASISSFPDHGLAQPLGSITSSTSAVVTSAPLVGVASSAFSIGLAPQSPRLAESEASEEEYQAVLSRMDGRNLYGDASSQARLRREPLAESVLDDVAASLLLSRGQDNDAPASVPAHLPTGVVAARDATGPVLPQDWDVSSAKLAAGPVVLGLVAGLWARRSGILHSRKRKPGSGISL